MRRERVGHSSIPSSKKHRLAKSATWSIEDITIVPVELDFSSSGQGHHSATAIETNGVRLFNAIELVVVEPAATQVEVCGCCGIPHCSPGGWVTFRRLGDRVIWLPAWDQMDEKSEYEPPSYLRSKGVPVFSPASWERLRALHGGLPTCDELPCINSREAARFCQWTAPGHVLGEYPLEPRVRQELLIAATDGDLVTEARVVDSFLQTQFGIPRQLSLVPRHVAVRPIEFWLDLPGTPGWTSFAYVGKNVCFLVDESTPLIVEGGPTSQWIQSP